MDNKWQKVYDTNLKYRAEIVKAVLADHGINSVLIDKQDTAYRFGHIEVYVAPDDVISAVKIVQDVISFR